MPYNCCIIVLVAFLAAIPWISADASKTMVTVSGASSGATMATQLHFAFSNDISGCAVLAGPPYYCAGSLLTAAKCLSGPVTSVSIPSLERKLVAYEKDGSIDKLANIQQNPVYIFTGKYDPVALPGIVKLNEKLYSAFGANIKTNYDMPATHGFATETFGDPCAIPNLNTFINNCNFSLAYDLLNHLHGGGLTKPERGYTTPLVGQMLVVDQEAFMHPPPALSVGNSPTARWLADSVSLYNPHNWGWLTSGLFNWTLPTVTDPVHKAAATRRTSFSFDDTGLVYFPSACATKQKCAIHVALHGCKQGKAYVDDIFVRKAGYLEVAELNNLIVIFPQVRSSLLSPINPMGCWDWWGYTNKSFSTKTGPQMAGVKKMIDTVRMINEAIAAAATVAK